MKPLRLAIDWVFLGAGYLIAATLVILTSLSFFVFYQWGFFRGVIFVAVVIALRLACRLIPLFDRL